MAETTRITTQKDRQWEQDRLLSEYAKLRQWVDGNKPPASGRQWHRATPGFPASYTCRPPRLVCGRVLFRLPFAWRMAWRRLLPYWQMQAKMGAAVAIALMATQGALQILGAPLELPGDPLAILEEQITRVFQFQKAWAPFLGLGLLAGNLTVFAGQVLCDACALARVAWIPTARTDADPTQEISHG